MTLVLSKIQKRVVMVQKHWTALCVVCVYIVYVCILCVYLYVYMNTVALGGLGNIFPTSEKPKKKRVRRHNSVFSLCIYVCICVCVYV